MRGQAATASVQVCSSPIEAVWLRAAMIPYSPVSGFRRCIDGLNSATIVYVQCLQRSQASIGEATSNWGVKSFHKASRSESVERKEHNHSCTVLQRLSGFGHTVARTSAGKPLPRCELPVFVLESQYARKPTVSITLHITAGQDIHQPTENATSCTQRTSRAEAVKTNKRQK